MSDHEGPIITITPDKRPGKEDGVLVNIRHPQGGILAYTGKALHMTIEEYDEAPGTPDPTGRRPNTPEVAAAP